MNLAKLQDTKTTHGNHLHFYILTMKSQKEISCMKRVASPGSMHDAGCLELVHWDDPEGGYGEGEGEEGSGWGTHVYLWRIHFDIWQN